MLYNGYLPGIKAVETTRRPAAERVIAPSVSHEIVSELRNELVVMSTQVSMDNWDFVSIEIQKFFGLGYCPRIIILTKQRALLELKSVEDKESVLTRKQVSFNDIGVSFPPWLPGVDTLSSDWFQLTPRWVTFLGIPYHPLTFETMNLLCSKFRSVKEFAKYGLVVGNISGAKVKVDKCDVRCIPHFIPLVDLGGVMYLVRIILEVEDGCEAEEVSSVNSGVYARVSEGRRRSYADMVVSNRGANRVKHCWKAISPNREEADNASRVSETVVFVSNGESNRQSDFQGDKSGSATSRSKYSCDCPVDRSKQGSHIFSCAGSTCRRNCFHHTWVGLWTS